MGNCSFGLSLMIMMPVMLLDYVAPPCCLLSCALGVKGVYHVSDDIRQLVAVGQQLDGVGLVQYYSVHDNLFKFIYRFIAPNASILELGETNAVMNVVKTQLPSFVAECWENLCRNFVSGKEIDGILYNKSSRWWGKIFTEDVPKGEMVELDVVAESFDKQHVLIGECKWTTEEDAERILFRLQRIAKYLPFVKHRQVHFAIFAK